MAALNRNPSKSPSSMKVLVLFLFRMQSGLLHLESRLQTQIRKTIKFSNMGQLDFASLKLVGEATGYSVLSVSAFLGGLSLHLNHLIASRVRNYDWPFGTLPFGIFWSNLDTMDLETYPRTYSGQF